MPQVIRKYTKMLFKKKKKSEEELADTNLSLKDL